MRSVEHQSLLAKLMGIDIKVELSPSSLDWLKNFIKNKNIPTSLIGYFKENIENESFLLWKIIDLKNSFPKEVMLIKLLESSKLVPEERRISDSAEKMRKRCQEIIYRNMTGNVDSTTKFENSSPFKYMSYAYFLLFNIIIIISSGLFIGYYFSNRFSQNLVLVGITTFIACIAILFIELYFIIKQDSLYD